jgi:hypothetical protein
MQFVPAKGPPSGRGWRVLTLLFASLLTLGVFTPITASAAYPAQLTVKDAYVTEGDTATTTAYVKDKLTKANYPQKVSFWWKTKDGTALAGTDYVAQAPTKKYVPKGAKKVFLPVQIVGDKVAEQPEFFKVKIFDARRAVIADAVGKVFITDNDPAPPPEKPKLIVRDVTVNEAAGTADFQIVVLSKTTRSTPRPRRVRTTWPRALTTWPSG